MEEEIRQQVGAFWCLIKKKQKDPPLACEQFVIGNVILLNNSQFSGEGVLCVFLDSFLPWQGFLSRKGQVIWSILNLENLRAM